MSQFLSPSSTTAAPTPRQVFQVNELLSTLKHGLEMNFPPLWVEGEISNFLAARSGHWYFTLKDARAQIRCACFRNRNKGKPLPREGQRMTLRGQATIYTQRGDLQLIVEDLEEAGAGALHQAFEQLKRLLHSEGLFDSDRKRALPASPRCIGIVSSADGAALHDILATLRRRNPLAAVRLYPSLVQGAQAPEQLRKALRQALNDNTCDVILLTRGGGSLEDLQAFNDESLAREIAAADTPIVSAVGHEVDFSISDFVADARAATPTAAAEMLSPDAQDWQRRIAQQRRQLQQLIQQRLLAAQQQAQQQQNRLLQQSPSRRLQERAQWLDDLQRRLLQLGQRHINQARQQLQYAHNSLAGQHPLTQIHHLQQQRDQQQQRLQLLTQHALTQQQQRLAHAHQRLVELSPQRVLQRGYSITRQGQQIVRQDDLADGSLLEIQLAQGELRAVVSKND